MTPLRTPRAPGGVARGGRGASGPGALVVRSDVARRVRGGHPWVYAEALAAPLPSGVAPGALVELVDEAGRFVARGFADPGAPIAVRVLSVEADEPVGAALVAARVAEALAARRHVVAAAASDALRLVHGEGDHLPGIVCDLYGDTAVLRADGAGARAALLEAAADALLASPAFRVARIFERRDRRVGHQTGGDAPRGAPLRGDEPPDPIVISEGAARFEVDVRRGQKTGFFLDQRDNRRRVAELATGARVLNLFCYTGGFSVHTALGGARHVTSVDQAAPAIAAARRSFARSGLDPDAHQFVVGDAFAFLARAAEAGARWDLVIVDPPSFAPSERALQPGLDAYRRLNAAALALVEPGGLLATASCSSHVTADAFLGVLRDAAGRGRRRVRVLEARGAAPDHPVQPAFPEGRYLKLLLAAIA